MTANNISDKHLGVGVIIEDEDGNLLLHLRDRKTNNMSGQWSLVGGVVEKDETPRQAALREVKEETNLEVKRINFLKKIEFDSNWDAVIFKVLVDMNVNTISLNEGAELRWFNKIELKNFLSELEYSNPFLDVLKNT